MPRRLAQVLPHDRWQTIGAFVVIVLIGIGNAWWSDYRDDQLERRVQRNTVTNAQQDAVRKQLVAGLRAADLHACSLINELRADNRREAQRDFNNLERNLGLIGIELTPGLLALAQAELTRTLNRNKDIDC